MTSERFRIERDHVFVGSDWVFEVDAQEIVTGKTFLFRLSDMRRQPVFTKDAPILFDINDEQRGIRYQVDRDDTLGKPEGWYLATVYEPENPTNPIAHGDIFLTYAVGVGDES